MIRKFVLFLAPLLILTILFLVIVIVINREGGKGALQITSVPNSQVYLDGKLIGKTPLCLCEATQLIKVGEYNLRLVPDSKDFQEFSQKIKINQGILTVADRTFDKEVSASSGSLITLSNIREKDKSELLIVSYPSGGRVILNSDSVGTTPLLLEDIPPSDHEIKILKDGYKEKVLKVKTSSGKRLEATINLGVRTDLVTSSPNASPSGNLVSKILILETPTGFLRVRENDSLNSAQITTVSPGEKFDLVSEKTGWYQIRLPDGSLGWISSEYGQKE